MNRMPYQIGRERNATTLNCLIYVVAAALILPALCFGYGFHDALTYGNAVDVISVRSAGMAGNRVFGADGPSALFLNPAALSAVNVFAVGSSASYLSWTEEVVDSTSTVQRSDRGLGSLNGSFAVRTGPSLVLGAGVARVADFQYDGTHYLPEEPAHPNIDIIETLKSTGGLWEAAGGASWQASELVTAGVSAGLRFGEVDYEYVYDAKFTPEVDSTASWKWDLSELCYHAGLTFGTDNFGAGASYTSGSEDHYYSRLSIAGKARAEHIGNTTMGFEGEIIDPFDRNYFNGKLSIETPIREQLNLLAGVGFNEGENMHKVGTVFSMGGNYTADRLRIDFALFHSSRSRVSTSFPEEYSDHVDDSWTHFCFGIQYRI